MKERLSDLEQRIDILLVAQDFDNKRGKLPPKLNKALNQYVRTLDDALYTGLVFFRGFEAIKNDEIRMADAASELVSKWVKSVDRNRSGKLVANFSATVSVATLEDFIEEIVAYAKVLPDFSTEYDDLERRENEKRAKNGDKVSLSALLKPSGKKKQRWLSLLKELFKITLDNSVDVVLSDLIENRQEASHTDIYKQNPVSGEHLKLWYLGTRYLIQTIIVSVHEMLSKRHSIVLPSA